MILKLRRSKSQSNIRKFSGGSRNSSARSRKSQSVSFGNSQLYEHRRKSGSGDPCAAHRGNSPSPSPVSRRKTISKISVEKQRKISKDKTSPRLQKTQTKIKDKPEAPAKMASTRSKRLYRFKRHFSDGYSESDPEDWFKNLTVDKLQTKKKSSKTMKSKKILALTNFLKTKKSSTIPEVVVQDFSERRNSVKIN